MATIKMDAVKAFPSQLIYDPAAAKPVIGDDADTSKVAVAPFHVQVDAVPVGTVIELQCRISDTADWVPIITYNSDNTPTVYVFGHDRVNFVRTIRQGTGNVKVHIQG